MAKLEKYLICSNVILYLFLAVFSYCYVDLNLTISQNPIVLNFVSFMQKLGYYNRPMATLIYTTFIIFAFGLFVLNLFLFYKSKVSAKYLKVSAIANTAILIFAYPFLSSDLFNYMFDAKIITQYHVSPYTHRPLDFPSDEWLRFMRWVHRYSPYGPVWLLMSIIPSVLGFGKFIITFLTFKLFIGSFHLLNAFLVHKILQKINPKVANFGTAFYVLNPLFLIEGVANAHNDVVLAALIFISIFFVVNSKNTHTLFVIAAGTLVKYIQILTLPWFIAYAAGKIKINKLIYLNLITMAIFTYIFSSFRVTVPFVSSGATQVQFQPWYLFWTLPLIAILPKLSLVIMGIAVSAGASLRYLPYLYNGDWSHQNTTEFMTAVLIIPLVLSIPFALKYAKSKQ